MLMEPIAVRVLRKPLGYRGQQVLAYIEAVILRTGTPPSYAMIADALDMPKDKVCLVIGRLERRGVLHRRAVGVRRNRGWHRPVIVLSTATT
jgi:SOS-response transcriptional repressor LexA